MKFLSCLSTIFSSAALLSSCAVSPNPIVVDQTLKADLQSEINRISPDLLYCDGMTTGTHKNNIDGRLKCDTGDGMYRQGWAIGIGAHGDFQSIMNSISEDGRPWRSPSYVNKDKSDSFSRDQLLGFLLATAKTGNTEPLAKVYKYFKANNYKMCKPDTDGKCNITDFFHVTMAKLLGEKVNPLSVTAITRTMLIEAKVVTSGYTTTLIADKIYLLSLLGYSDTNMMEAATKIHSNYPSNIWYNTVYHLTTLQNSDFNKPAAQLLACMKQWKTPGNDWAWNTETNHCTTSTGHELVALAKLFVK